MSAPRSLRLIRISRRTSNQRMQTPQALLRLVHTGGHCVPIPPSSPKSSSRAGAKRSSLDLDLGLRPVAAGGSTGRASARAFSTSSASLLPHQPPPQQPPSGGGAGASHQPSQGASASASSNGQQSHGRSPRKPSFHLWTAIFFGLGLAFGDKVRAFLLPPPPPQPGSPEDEARKASIRQRACELPLVQSLLSPSSPYTTSWDAYSSLPASALPHRLTTGPLGTSAGIGAFQRVFLNRDTGETLSVVYLGHALAGWPGVVHGGASATLLDEALGRTALASLPGRTGVTANLELKYRRKVKCGKFYVVRCRVLPEEELEEGERGKRGRKVWVKGSLETLKGKVCVEAKGLFVSPRGIQLRKLGEQF